MAAESRSDNLPILQHQTLEVKDHHYLGRNGLPIRHVTKQRIRALDTLEMPMTYMPFRFNTNAALVVVKAGGVAGQLYQVDESLYAVDVMLNDPLQPGEETELEYNTLLKYRDIPLPEFRRRIGAKVMEKLDISVIFDEVKVPTQVWKSEWEDHKPESLIVQEQSISLAAFDEQSRADLRAHAVYENIANTTVGFRWQWL